MSEDWVSKDQPQDHGVRQVFGPPRWERCPSCDTELHLLSYEANSSIPNRYHAFWQRCSKCTWMGMPVLFTDKEEMRAYSAPPGREGHPQVTYWAHPPKDDTQ